VDYICLAVTHKEVLMTICRDSVQGSHASWKVMEFKKGIFQAQKSWKMTVVMERHGKVVDLHNGSWNFLIEG